MFIIFKRKEQKIKYIKLKSEEKQAEPEILKKKTLKKPAQIRKNSNEKNEKPPPAVLTGRPNSRRTRAERGSVPLMGGA
jgi:hypothetical protein